MTAEAARSSGGGGDAVRILLRGERCTLRDWSPGDAAALEQLVTPGASWHATNGPYFGTPSADDLAEVRRGFLAQAATPADELPVPRTSLAIADPASDRLLGCVSWYWESKATDWRRLGVVLYDEQARGRGIGREALTLWTTYLFATTHVVRLDLATYSGNLGMQRAAEAAGFVLEARMRSARRWAGGVHDALVYGVLREEWEPGLTETGLIETGLTDPGPTDPGPTETRPTEITPTRSSDTRRPA